MTEKTREQADQPVRERRHVDMARWVFAVFHAHRLGVRPDQCYRRHLVEWQPPRQWIGLTESLELVYLRFLLEPAAAQFRGQVDDPRHSGEPDERHTVSGKNSHEER